MTTEVALHPVRILQLPVPLWVAWNERQEELRREFALIAMSPGNGASVPARLLALVDRAYVEYGELIIPAREQIAAAARGGAPHTDVTYQMPRSAAVLADELSRALDAADEFCRSGQLLTLAATPELVRYRHWYLGEFRRQLGGLEPLPWPQYRDEAERASTP